MSETIPPTEPSYLTRTLAAFKRLTLPQSVVIVGLLAAGVACALWLPEDRWSGVTRIVVLFITGGGVAGTAFLNSRPAPVELTSERPTPPMPPAPPPLPPGRVTRRDGSMGVVDLVLLFVVLVGALVLMPLIHGCGAAQVVKPALVTACGVARVACGVVDTACDVVDGALAEDALAAADPPSSGGETTTTVEVSGP